MNRCDNPDAAMAAAATSIIMTQPPAITPDEDAAPAMPPATTSVTATTVDAATIAERSIDCDVAVIGGGIVGLATAYQLQRHHPQLRVVVLEKEATLASHQTGHNSGVIHSGLYYRPGSVKAENCVKGRAMLLQLAEEEGIPHRVCGKVLVATTEDEVERLEQLQVNGRDNGIPGIERLSAEQLGEYEPAVSGLEGLYVPTTGVIDFTAVATVLARRITTAATPGRVITGFPVRCIAHQAGRTRLATVSAEPSSQGSQAAGTGLAAVTAGYVINCAGLHADRVARLAGADPRVRIVPFRGSYYTITGRSAGMVRSLIYPVPDPRFPFLGVHFTRMIDDHVECGPNALFCFSREGYHRFAVNLRDTWESLTFIGTWKLFLGNLTYGMREYLHAACRGLYMTQLRRMIPSLAASDLRAGKAGVRAAVVTPQGRFLDDFEFLTHENTLHVLNAASPAATASLAIGETIQAMAQQQFHLK